MEEIKNEFNIGDMVMTVNKVSDEFGTGGSLPRFEKVLYYHFIDV